MLDAYRRHDDPGIAHIDRLACGGAIDVQMPRRSAWPERAMRRINRSFWLLFWLFLGFSVTATIWVHP